MLLLLAWESNSESPGVLLPCRAVSRRSPPTRWLASTGCALSIVCRCTHRCALPRCALSRCALWQHRLRRCLTPRGRKSLFCLAIRTSFIYLKDLTPRKTPPTRCLGSGVSFPLIGVSPPLVCLQFQRAPLPRKRRQAKVFFCPNQWAIRCGRSCRAE